MLDMLKNVNPDKIDSQKAIQVLGGKVIDDVELSLPASDEQRTLILIEKIKKTLKKYPRQAGTPRRKPIH